MKALLNWRYYILMAVGLIAILGLFSVPIDDLPFGRWIAALIISKVIGLGALYLNYRMVAYWEARNRIPEMSKMMQEEDDVWE
ncbi:hypothetical protein [uncultured Alistipes sp.]|uniref:hypothetical protein n=1 Tax=uncultured Alistipes sp. TaxID=538949 RepID=UPI00262FDB1A|nr:hypothetical protein [uncultured Alistipes sp.]